MKPFCLTASALVGTWLTLAAVATAQVPTSLENPHPRAEPVAPKLGTAPISDDRSSRVHWDTEANGTIWVRGRGYKASFGVDGATYFPLFGGEQPRHFPIAMSLGSATSGGLPIALKPIQGATRDRDRVVIDRGAIDEIYEIGLEGVEQTFVVESKPQADLKLFVSLATELGCHENEAGITLSNEFGTVVYGDAFAREPGDEKHPLASRTVAGGIEIEVPSEYLATAGFPLIVDPLISTFGVAVLSPLNDFNSSVAYDATHNRYLFAYEEGTAAFDGDVYAKLTDSAGTVLGQGYVDMTTEDWYEPSVANLNAYDQFLVAGRAQLSAPSSSEVRGRLTSASSFSLGAKLTIASASFGSISITTGVGGDPFVSAPSLPT